MTRNFLSLNFFRFLFFAGKQNSWLSKVQTLGKGKEFNIGRLASISLHLANCFLGLLRDEHTNLIYFPPPLGKITFYKHQGPVLVVVLSKLFGSFAHGVCAYFEYKQIQFVAVISLLLLSVVQVLSALKNTSPSERQHLPKRYKNVAYYCVRISTQHLILFSLLFPEVFLKIRINCPTLKRNCGQILQPHFIFDESFGLSGNFNTITWVIDEGILMQPLNYGWKNKNKIKPHHKFTAAIHWGQFHFWFDEIV